MADGMWRLSAAIGGVTHHEVKQVWDYEYGDWAYRTSIWDNQDSFDLCYEFNILENESCSKLYELEMLKRNEKAQELEDSKSDIGWGSQIRSYVLDDQRIKDLRTNVQTSNCQNVLDGDLDMFIEASLKAGL